VRWSPSRISHGYKRADWVVLFRAVYGSRRDDGPIRFCLYRHLRDQFECARADYRRQRSCGSWLAGGSGAFVHGLCAPCHAKHHVDGTHLCRNCYTIETRVWNRLRLFLSCYLASLKNHKTTLVLSCTSGFLTHSTCSALEPVEFRATYVIIHNDIIDLNQTYQTRWIE